MITITEQDFVTLRDFVLVNYGIDLTKKKVLVQGRLTGILRQRGIDNFSDYLQLVLKDTSGAEVQLMLNQLTTNLTFFLREQQHFSFLTQTGLPSLDKGGTRQNIRVWSAGCSSGEEPYTLLMTLLDFYKNRPGMQISMLASDISQQVLVQAQQGIYPAEKLEGIPPSWKSDYFVQITPTHYQVKRELRGMITFRVANLMSPFRFSAPFEIIFCRNVMIYFEKQRKDELVQKFCEWTAPGGYFFVSHSETINRGDCGLKMVKPSIFQKES